MIPDPVLEDLGLDFTDPTLRLNEADVRLREAQDHYRKAQAIGTSEETAEALREMLSAIQDQQTLHLVLLDPRRRFEDALRAEEALFAQLQAARSRHDIARAYLRDAATYLAEHEQRERERNHDLADPTDP